jgi:hypothetical protein
MILNRPVFKAGGISTWLELKLEPVRHPWVHWAQ